MRYDAEDPSRNYAYDEGLGVSLLLFLALSAIVLLQGLWTLVVRGTRIGGGIAVIARSRAKSQAKGRAGRAASPAGPSGS